MTESNDTHQKSTLMLALVAALIIAQFFPQWLVAPVNRLIPPGSGIRPDTLSKLKARVMGPFLRAIEMATRLGRKPVLAAPELSAAIDEECARIKQVFEQKRESGPKRRAQEYLLEAFDQLLAKTPITQKLFCEKLGVPDRDLRYWRQRKLEPARPLPVPEPKPASRPKGEGRFDLERTVPGIQQMADTTEIKIAGNKLKIIAVQDPGNRHRELWSRFHVDVTETAQMVSELLGQAPDGTQTIHDRATPYVADETRDTLDEKGCEVAPCKEYTPTEKATLERSNRTAKQAIAPLVDFFDSLATIVSELKCPAIGAHFVQLALELFHHAFHLGHRELPHPLEGHDPHVLECIAEAQLEKARVAQRSKRSLLTWIHDAYAMAVGLRSFIRAHVNYALEDILEAETRLADAVLMGTHIREFHRYFAAILSNVATPRREQRRRERIHREKLARERQEERKHEAWLAHLDEHPLEMLRSALNIMALQWRHEHFLFDKPILGSYRLELAISNMAAASPLSFHVDVLVETKRWYLEHDGNKPPLDIVLSIIEKLLDDHRRGCS